VEWLTIADPEGDFVEAIGRQHSAEKAAKIIVDHMSDWRGEKAGEKREHERRGGQHEFVR